MPRLERREDPGHQDVDVVLRGRIPNHVEDLHELAFHGRQRVTTFDSHLIGFIGKLSAHAFVAKQSVATKCWPTLSEFPLPSRFL